MHSLYYILIVACCTLGSQLILKKGISEIVTSEGITGISILFFIKAFQSHYVWFSIIIQAFSFSLWMFVISKEKLGIAFGMSGAFFYILLPLMSWLIYGEKLSLFQWAGLACITTGVSLMMVK